jgi:CheY-like chemotaxis protein
MKKVLLIDDDDGLRTELIQVLGFEGYEAIEAANGHEGVLAARQQQPHLIICDVNMPILNGFAVVKELRQDSQTEHIPVIFLSAAHEPSDVQRGMQLGVVAYLAKPCSLEEFISVIRSQIGG